MLFTYKNNIIIFFFILFSFFLCPTISHGATDAACRLGCDYSGSRTCNFDTYWGYVMPVHGLCVSGVPTPVTGSLGSNLVYWTCNSTDGGASASCKAQKSSGGVCNYNYHGKVYITQPSNSVLCSTGNVTNVTVTKDILRWECQEAGITNNSSCWAMKRVDGVCGSSNGQYFSSFPNTNLCSSGGAYAKGLAIGREEFEDQNKFDWVCEGQGGGSTVHCSANRLYNATDGKCGTSHGFTFSSIPTTGLCSQGSPTEVTDFKYSASTTWTWMCLGASGGDDVVCHATKQGASSNPTCGSANYTTFSTWPSDDQLCGSNNTVYHQNGQNMGGWTWTCYGTNSDGTRDISRLANCKAYKPSLDFMYNGILLDACRINQITQIDSAGIASAA